MWRRETTTPQLVEIRVSYTRSTKPTIGQHLPGRYLASVAVATAATSGATAGTAPTSPSSRPAQIIRRVGLVSTLLDTLREPADPPVLVLVGRRQQQHLAGVVRVVVQLARRQRVVVVHVLLVQLEATPGGRKQLA